MTLTINMKKLASGGKDLERSSEIEIGPWLKGRQDVKAKEPLKVKLIARGSTDGMIVECECSVMLEHHCSKCLSAFAQPLSFTFNEQFTSKPEAADEEDDIHLATHDDVDMLPYVEENLQLSMPFVAVCQDECKGLCPVCGKNRNEHDCQCKEEKIDPRLAGLKDFFNKE